MQQRRESGEELTFRRSHASIRIADADTHLAPQQCHGFLQPGALEQYLLLEGGKFGNPRLAAECFREAANLLAPVRRWHRRQRQ